MSNLYDICQEVLQIMEGLEYGTIEFTYDKLACAMKVGHPSEILGEVISEIFFEVRDGITPDKAKVESVLKGLKRFRRSFKVKEMNEPIKKLEAYVKEIDLNT
jgi:hypothetical protein